MNSTDIASLAAQQPVAIVTTTPAPAVTRATALDVVPVSAHAPGTTSVTTIREKQAPNVAVIVVAVFAALVVLGLVGWFGYWLGGRSRACTSNQRAAS
jgi:hypothetical protein